MCVEPVSPDGPGIGGVPLYGDKSIENSGEGVAVKNSSYTAVFTKAGLLPPPTVIVPLVDLPGTDVVLNS